MKIAYKNIRIGPARLKVIEQANEIIAEYTTQGFDLTLRQLFYQYVSRGLIPNRQSEYKKLGDTIADGRIAGLIDWDCISDRTRNLQSLTTWANPQEVLDTYAQYFRQDLWASQSCRIEVWIEKDALVGVIENVCNSLRVPYFSCRGYASLSEVWGASSRFIDYAEDDKECHILHLGDHDPSGVDMTRDIRDRMNDLFGAEVEVTRLALNMDQVKRYNPPPNPVKMTDSRSNNYSGDECWELDALDPRVIAQLITDAVLKLRDEKAWKTALKTEQSHRDDMLAVAERWDEVVAGG